jgi:CDP-glucose 4,6-dehydratase
VVKPNGKYGNKRLSNNFYQYLRRQKVFLTGHTGFKGSWLLAWLHSIGAIVQGYALAPENSSDLYHLIDGDACCHSQIADIRDRDSLQKAILDFQPDFIFHLAAQPLVRLSYSIPIDTFAVNSMGTAHVLDALRSLAKPCILVCITTDKVYENLEQDYAYKESDRLGGHDPYSASKAAAEIVIASFQKSYFQPEQWDVHHKAIAVARAGNVIGAGDWAQDRIIPDIIRALQQDKSIELRNPKAVRPWQHVLEPLAGYLLLGARLAADPVKFARAWNFGPAAADNLTVESLVQTAIATWGKGAYHLATQNNQLHEARLLQLDIQDSIEILGWKPQWNASSAIAYTIQGYQDLSVKGRNAILQQIQEYCNYEI